MSNIAELRATLREDEGDGVLQWLETKVFNVAERVSEQYHEWALFRDDEPGDEGD